MERLSYLIDPRFMASLASFAKSPQAPLNLNEGFLRDVPNRRLSERSLRLLLKAGTDAGIISFANGVWRAPHDQSIESLLREWLKRSPAVDERFLARCAAFSGDGAILPSGLYEPLAAFAARPTISPSELSRFISGPCDLRHLTGRLSKHSDADYLMIYRSHIAIPITENPEISPRIPAQVFPGLPCDAAALYKASRFAREAWWGQVDTFLGSCSREDLSTFIVYSKDLLDSLIWGRPNALRSSISPEQASDASEMLRLFGVHTADLMTVWRSLPTLYRSITRLSYGARYLSNNLSNPTPPPPDVEAFLRVCALPQKVQAAISTRRSGHSLFSIIRPLKILHKAIRTWPGRTTAITEASACTAALGEDADTDKLSRRATASTIKRLQVARPIDLVDALFEDIPSLPPCEHADEDLRCASAMASYWRFLSSPQGRAYAEIRLALHSEIDFQRRFNSHKASPPQRYAGVWSGALAKLARRVEDTRHTVSPKEPPLGAASGDARPPA